MFPVNCYVLWDDTKEAVVIDPGCFYEEEKQALKKFILTNELNVKHLLNTHLHLDDISVVQVFAQWYRFFLQLKTKHSALFRCFVNPVLVCFVCFCR